MKTFEWQKYISAFIITSAIFATAFYLSGSINDRRIKEIQNIQDKIAMDILALETQFDLLAESSCKDATGATALSKELNSLARKLDFMETSLGTEDLEVTELKKYYSLLQVKDYLLMKKISEKCGIDPVFVLYFYSNEGDCSECEREGYVLTRLRKEYPKLRIYSFDYNLDLAPIQTMRSLFDLNGTLPTLVIGDEVFYGFYNTSQLESLIPSLEDFQEDTSTSTESTLLEDTATDDADSQ